MLNEEPVNGTNAESIWQIIKDSYSNPGLQCWEGPHLQDCTIDGASRSRKTLVDSTEGVAMQQQEETEK